MLCSATTRGSGDPRAHGCCGGVSTHGGLSRRPFQARAWHTLRAAGPSLGRCGAPAEARCSRPRSSWAGAPLRRHGLLQRLDASQELTAVSGLIPLSQDVMTFLASTVFVIPVFRRLKISPILGYLLSGLVLQKFGMIKDIKDIDALAELGVLFLLFEMGLELSIDRLKALAKYAFGMGSLQMLISTVAFTAFALPLGAGVGTMFLERYSDAPDSLVTIRSIDEAIVIGASLSLSSSAFVLQLMGERGEMQTRFGAATLGILLLQDIAVVPFLVLLPLIEGGQGVIIMDGASPVSLLTVLGPTVLKTLAGLGVLLLGGRFVLRRIFELVAESKSSESFISLCLLTVTGASQLTSLLGLSDTMGAFIAGVLLSETSYRVQVEADIKPFRTLLLGLFFVTTGCSINTTVLANYWEVIAWLTVGLIAIKATIISALGPLFGLTRKESIQTGFMLSQGGEFAFVLLSLANQLKLLPEDLNQVLIIVVVLSMALTPVLAELGKATGEWADRRFSSPEDEDPHGSLDEPMSVTQEPVVICGFGAQGQVLANMLESPLASTSSKATYVAFDSDVARVRASRAAGFNVVYGDATTPALIMAAGVKKPKAIAVAYSSQERVMAAVENLRLGFDKVPIYACATDMAQAAALRQAGATSVVIAPAEQGLAVGSLLLDQLGASSLEVGQLKEGIEEALLSRTEALVKSEIARRERRKQREREQGLGRFPALGGGAAPAGAAGAGAAPAGSDPAGTGVPAGAKGKSGGSNISVGDIFVFDTLRRNASSPVAADAPKVPTPVPAEIKGGLLLATYDEDHPLASVCDAGGVVVELRGAGAASRAAQSGGEANGEAVEPKLVLPQPKQQQPKQQ